MQFIAQKLSYPTHWFRSLPLAATTVLQITSETRGSCPASDCQVAANDVYESDDEIPIEDPYTEQISPPGRLLRQDDSDEARAENDAIGRKSIKALEDVVEEALILRSGECTTADRRAIREGEERL